MWGKFFIYANNVNHELYQYLMKDNQYIDIDEYCIIDDDDDMTDEQKQPHFVHIDWENGLNETYYSKIKKILKL